MINKEEYNHSSDVKSSFGWVINSTCLAKLVGKGNKPLSPWLFGQEYPYFRSSLMGMKKASCSMNLTILNLWNSGTSLSKAKGQAFIDRGGGVRMIHNIHGIGFITKKLP